MDVSITQRNVTTTEPGAAVLPQCDELFYVLYFYLRTVCSDEIGAVDPLVAVAPPLHVVVATLALLHRHCSDI